MSEQTDGEDKDEDVDLSCGALDDAASRHFCWRDSDAAKKGSLDGILTSF